MVLLDHVGCPRIRIYLVELDHFLLSNWYLIEVYCFGFGLNYREVSRYNVLLYFCCISEMISLSHVHIILTWESVIYLDFVYILSIRFHRSLLGSISLITYRKNKNSSITEMGAETFFTYFFRISVELLLIVKDCFVHMLIQCFHNVSLCHLHKSHVITYIHNFPRFFLHRMVIFFM